MLKHTYILFLSVFILSFAACSDDDEVRVPNQLFRPAVFTADVETGRVLLQWIPIKNATYYLEVSRDDQLFQTDVRKYEIEDEYILVLTDLISEELYSARIKSVSTQPGIQDSEYAIVTFTTR
ncbi:MAG: hypothetical protein LUE93_17070 [Bacteroides sp.]|nr:hypothetical protein [Bacteroides sp.]